LRKQNCELTLNRTVCYDKGRLSDSVFFGGSEALKPKSLGCESMIAAVEV